MGESLSILRLARFRPPISRVLALDAGSRRVKLLLAQRDFGRLRLLREEVIDLEAEGLVSPEEIQAHLHRILEDWGNPPLALTLPQHLSISQVLDLPQAPESEIEKLIAEETVKLSGVSESPIVYDFVRTETVAGNRQQFWVTLCQEGDIRERIQKLGVEHEDICEVTTTANALIATFRSAAPLSSRAILLHVGAQTTVVVVLLAGQGAFATSFQMGGDFFTRAIARLLKVPEKQAESIKLSQNLLEGPEASPEYAAVVDGWISELQRQLSEWFQSNRELDPGSFELVGSGGGLEQPGFTAYLASRAGMEIRPWPAPARSEVPVPSRGFEVALGTALQALGYSAQPVSLLPHNYRVGWRKRVTRQRIEIGSILVAAVCILVLAMTTWHKLNVISAKESLLAKIQAAQETVDANAVMTSELVNNYENLRPILAGQQNTLDILRSLDLLQLSRSNRFFWYAVVADQASYFSLTPSILVTNRPSPGTNPPAPPPELARLMSAPGTNLTPARPGLIAELVVPGDPEPSRKLIRDLVSQLKQAPLLSKVDLLSDDLRRDLADPRVVVPDRSFVLQLNFEAAEFEQPVRRRPAAAGSTRGPRRAGLRTGNPAGNEPPSMNDYPPGTPN